LLFSLAFSPQFPASTLSANRAPLQVGHKPCNLDEENKEHRGLIPEKEGDLQWPYGEHPHLPSRTGWRPNYAKKGPEGPARTDRLVVFTAKAVYQQSDNCAPALDPIKKSEPWYVLCPRAQHRSVRSDHVLWWTSAYNWKIPSRWWATRQGYRYKNSACIFYSLSRVTGVMYWSFLSSQYTRYVAGGGSGVYHLNWLRFFPRQVPYMGPGIQPFFSRQAPLRPDYFEISLSGSFSREGPGLVRACLYTSCCPAKSCPGTRRYIFRQRHGGVETGKPSGSPFQQAPWGSNQLIFAHCRGHATMQYLHPIHLL